MWVGHPSTHGPPRPTGGKYRGQGKGRAGEANEQAHAGSQQARKVGPKRMVTAGPLTSASCLGGSMGSSFRESPWHRQVRRYDGPLTVMRLESRGTNRTRDTLALHLATATTVSEFHFHTTRIVSAAVPPMVARNLLSPEKAQCRKSATGQPTVPSRDHPFSTCIQTHTASALHLQCVCVLEDHSTHLLSWRWTWFAYDGGMLRGTPTPETWSPSCLPRPGSQSHPRQHRQSRRPPPLLQSLR